MVRVLETGARRPSRPDGARRSRRNAWHAPIDVALEAIASVMTKLRAAPPTGHSFTDVRDYQRAWPKHLRLYGGAGPIDADLFEIGERLFIELCDSSADPVVLHGDLHYGNVLSSDREGWLAIDPKGVTGEPSYEVGDLFRNRVDELTNVGYESAPCGGVETVADITDSISRARPGVGAGASGAVGGLDRDVPRAPPSDARALDSCSR